MLGIFILFFAVGVVTTFLSYQHHFRASFLLSDTKVVEESGIVLKNIHHEATSNGKREWVLDAHRVKYLNERRITLFEGISVVFFLNNGGKVQLTAKEGSLQNQTHDIDIRGDIIVRTGLLQMKTEAMHYNHRRHTIITTSPVLLEGKGIKLKGKRMTFDLETDLITLEGGVQGSLSPL